MTLTLGPRRGVFIDLASDTKAGATALPPEEGGALESLDTVYRALCALMYNYVPTSGHPGGSISSGRIAQSLVFGGMDYDVSLPDRDDADTLVYAAGHKALGLYSLWALRDEVLRIGAPDLLPAESAQRLRLEDLLGFRRNPLQATPLFARFRSRALDGHPTPATPYVRVATGASGVGLASAVGLALGAADYFGVDAPRVHALEGEGGLTPGRVSEALAAAGTASLGNLVVHVDWNQASIDSNHVCRDGLTPGDYVQWTPAELFTLNDWNVVLVPDGMDFGQVVSAQRAAEAFGNGQPTAVVYRTTKGWRYGVEGKASHGAGHKFCSDAFHAAAMPLLEKTGRTLSRCDANAQRCRGGEAEAVVEECFWEALTSVRAALERDRASVKRLARRLDASRDRLEARGRKPRAGAPKVVAVFDEARACLGRPAPDDVAVAPGSTTTVRAELGRTLAHYNKAGGGALFTASADLLGSTSVNLAAQGFPEGFFNAKTNPGARALATGGICEDAMAGILSGLSAFGRHVGVGSSYGAFLAPLGHIAARLHAIGAQSRRAASDDLYRPFILVCAHAGLKTGEDGPTHADPQALQLLQENFPPGVMATLTPWDPQEVWPLMTAALARQPSVIAPFVTRPNERVPDRRALGLAPAGAAAQGVYLLKAAKGPRQGTVVLQESGAAFAFVEGALPLLEKAGVDVDVFYVASAELFDGLPQPERDRIFPPDRAAEAMGITGFTLPTMYRWVTSELGRAMTLHPFRKGHFLGSGAGARVLAEAGLDGRSQFEAVSEYVEKRRKPRRGRRRTRAK
jgi:transketolase